MPQKYWEVEVSDDEQTVAALFDSLEAAQDYADDCSQIACVNLVSCTGPYTVFSRETVWQAYVRTWNMFNRYKGVSDE